jgi:uncharacterized protein
LTEDQRELIEKARSSHAAAKWLMEGSYPDFAASRVYYAMFYVAQALLEGEGLAFFKHSAVIAAFGQHFARTGRVPVEFHRYLLAAQDLRHSGDYGPLHTVTLDQAREQITRAEAFLSLAESLRGPLPPSTDGPL